MVIWWDDLIAEWGRRIAVCRALRSGGRGGQVERMRERVLGYLLRRYEADDDRVTVVEEDLPPVGEWDPAWPPPLPEPTFTVRNRPPRTGAEMRPLLLVIHHRPDDRGVWWRWLWRGGW